MQDFAKLNSAPVAPVSAEISMADLLQVLEVHSVKPLVFHYDGHDVKPGYHVTEVKSGMFNALDCGANPESWQETFIQLWDIVEDSRGHMPAGKFLAIVRKVGQSFPIAFDARLTFEVSDGVRPMQLYKADDAAIEDGAVRVRLSPRPSSCKPRDRWLEAQPSSCCAPAVSQSCCA